MLSQRIFLCSQILTWQEIPACVCLLKMSSGTILSRRINVVARRKVAYAAVNFTTSRGVSPCPGAPPIVPRMPDIDLMSDIAFVSFMEMV